MEKDFMTPEEIAKVLRVTSRTVTEWLGSGTMHGYLIGRRWRVPASSFSAFMERADNSLPSGSAPHVVTASPSPIELASPSRADRRRQKLGRR